MTNTDITKAPGRETPARILLVGEDSLVVRELEESLTELGFQVAGRAVSGTDAISQAKSLAPDLVLMDIDVPDTADGIEAAREIRRAQTVPVVFLGSNSDSPETIKRAARVSPFGCLVKPFTRGELIWTLEAALERSHEERESRRHERALVASLDESGDGVILTDATGRITHMNRAAEVLSARSFEFTCGRMLDEALVLVTQDTGRITRWPVGEALRERMPRFRVGPFDLQRPAPEPLPVEIAVSPVFGDAGEPAGTVCVFRDLRPRIAGDARVLRLEEQTRMLGDRVERSEQRFRAMVDNAADGVWIVSSAGEVLDCNRRAEEIHGVPRAAMVGRHVTDLVAPEMADRARDAFGRVFAEGFVRADGFDIIGPDRQRRTVDYSGCLVPFGEGEVVLALERDVTEEKQLEAQNRQLHRLEAVGRLTGGVAHDFNNILGVILANSHFLLESISADDPRHEDAEEIRRAAESGASLTRQLLAFSRKQVLEPTPLDLNAVVGGLGKMLRRVIGEDVRLVFTAADDLGPVLADRGQIEQVLMNLVVNARDAMPGGGDLRIETATIDLDEGCALGHVPVTPGLYVVLTVTDTGIGMDEETRSRAFEPFFTTKERGRGTGLGLSTVYGIVKQSGGTTWLYSEPGHGTVVKIYLPRHDAPARPVSEGIAAIQLNGCESVLLIEDDDSIRGAIQRVLEGHGYRVQIARSYAEVLAAGEERAPLDLVLSDMIIPGGHGPEAAAQIAGSRGAGLLFMSGYTDHAMLQGGVPEGMRFLQKPFTPESLLRKVREVLDRRPSETGVAA